MNEETNHAIRKARHDLQQAEQAYRKWLQLSAKRDELEVKEQELLDQFHANHLLMHQKQSYHAQEATRLSPKIAQQQEMLLEVRNKKQALDTLLDSLEEHSEETIQRLKEKLIDEIIQAHPEQKAIYEEFKRAIDRCNDYEAELSTSLDLTGQLSHFLESALAIRQSVKRRGIFSYIFGPNPNVSISEFLLAADSVARLSLPVLAEYSLHSLGGLSMQETYTKLIGFLNEFRPHCKQSWSFHRLDTLVAIDLERIKAWQIVFESTVQQVKAEKKDILNKIEEWMSKQ